MEIWWDINNRWMSRIWRRVQYCWPPKWTTLAKIYSCRCPVRISPLLVGRQKNLVHDSPPIWSSDWSKLLHNKSPILPIFPGDFPVISHPIGFPSDFPSYMIFPWIFWRWILETPRSWGRSPAQEIVLRNSVPWRFFSAFHLVSWPGILT